MQGAARVPGLPHRMGAAVSALFARGAVGGRKLHVIWELQREAERVRLDADDDAILCAADRAARECYQICAEFKTVLAIKIQIDHVCKRLGVPFPVGEDDSEILKRAVDPAWWLRNIRKEFSRRFEHAAIELGMVGVGVDAYISRESALRQARRNLQNEKLLEATQLQNENGDIYTLAQLAGTSVANKSNRVDELMTRIRGFEEVAHEVDHVAMFWTITCPSKFHSVGGTNKKYNGATPRQGQAYLSKIWSRMRSALKRKGIQPYGFRIAEPHTDGCPHWHMLFFVQRSQAPEMEKVIYRYAMLEDGDEAGAKDNRVKLVNIETGKGGSAAGYIIKYVCKNINGTGVGDHKAFESNETYTIKTDMFGNEEITPSARVTYWAQVWGIRQFQQIGGAPVGVWRELRRVEEEKVKGAPNIIQAAWDAVQSVKSEAPELAKQADWAAYTRLQGGPQVGRSNRIKLYRDEVTVEGRYAVYRAKKPVGVYAVGYEEEIIKSLRYTWTKVDKKEGGFAIAFGGARTGVNNCTDAGKNAAWINPKPQPEALKNQKICSANVLVWWDEERTKLKPDQKHMEIFLHHRKAGEPAHLTFLNQKYER
jgi:hypothetical protein